MKSIDLKLYDGETFVSHTTMTLDPSEPISRQARSQILAELAEILTCVVNAPAMAEAGPLPDWMKRYDGIIVGPYDQPATEATTMTEGERLFEVFCGPDAVAHDSGAACSVATFRRILTEHASLRARIAELEGR